MFGAPPLCPPASCPPLYTSGSKSLLSPQGQSLSATQPTPSTTQGGKQLTSILPPTTPLLQALRPPLECWETPVAMLSSLALGYSACPLRGEEGESKLTHPPRDETEEILLSPPPLPVPTPAPAPREGPHLYIRCSLEGRARNGQPHGDPSCVYKIIETQKPAPRLRAESWCVPTLRPSFSPHPQPKPPPIGPS